MWPAHHFSAELLGQIFPLIVMGEEIVVDFAAGWRHQLRNLALAITAAEQLKRISISEFLLSTLNRAFARHAGRDDLK